MKKDKCNRYSGIGGQAVLEGIMMKNKDQYAVAVRKPDGEIEVEVDVYRGVMHDSKITKLPFIRGIFNFIDSLMLGTKSLNYSATFYEEEDAEETKADKMLDKLFGGKAEKVLMGITTVVSVETLTVDKTKDICCAGSCYFYRTSLFYCFFFRRLCEKRFFDGNFRRYYPNFDLPFICSWHFCYAGY